MTYNIPVASGATVDLRIFMANGWPGTSANGARIFDVTVEGAPTIVDLDLSATYGHQVGGMQRFVVTDDGDGILTVVFSHNDPLAENPLVNAIEVRAT